MKKLTTNIHGEQIGYEIVDGMVTALYDRDAVKTGLTFEAFIAFMKDTAEQDIRIAAFGDEGELMFTLEEITAILAL